jgi:antirestriction protein
MARIYVSSLTDYNAGILHGTWIEIDGDTIADEINEQIGAMLAASPAAAKGHGPAEEWRIDDHEGWKPLDPSRFTLDALPKLAELLDGHDGEAFAAFLDNDHRDDIDEAADAFRDAYQGTHTSLEAWAEDFMESTGQIDTIPANLRPYFDFEAFARDCELSGDIWTADVSGGVAVFDNH